MAQPPSALRIDIANWPIGRHFVQWLRCHGELIVLFALPLALLCISSIWLFNKFGDIDTWFYYGHFYALFHNDPTVGAIPNDYYRTRLAYTLPGAILYALFPENAAKVLFMMLVYTSIIGSFHYVLRHHTTRTIAFAGSILLALDIYFVRSVGWQYVDNGVIAYQAMSFALLTLAATKNWQRTWIMLAGFMAVSMISIHVGAGLTLFMMAGYVWVLLGEQKTDKKIGRFFSIAGYSALGALLGLIFYGFLHAYFYGDSFFPLLEQLKVAKSEAQSVYYATPVPFLATDGFWLITHSAVFLACCVAISLMVFLRRGAWTGFLPFCLLSSTLLLATIAGLEVTHHSYLLSREGEYVSFFLVPTYFAVTALLFRTGQTNWGIACFTLVLFFSALAFKLLKSGLGLHYIYPLPMPLLVTLISCALALPSLVRKTWATVMALLLFAGLSLWIPWGFKRDDSVITATQAIRSVAGYRIPRIYYDVNEDIGRGLLWSISASFTERGNFRHGENYPDFSKVAFPLFFDFHSKDIVVVLSSKVTAEEARKALSLWVDGVRLVKSFRIEREEMPLLIHCFEITNVISLPTDLLKQKASDGSIPGKALSASGGEVEGEARTAREDKAGAGILTFGPYAQLEPGSYTATFRYTSEGDGHNWDLLADRAADPVMARGTFPDTKGSKQSLTVPFTTEVALKNFQARSFFSGHGKLSIISLMIKQQTEKQ